MGGIKEYIQSLIVKMDPEAEGSAHMHRDARPGSSVSSSYVEPSVHVSPMPQGYSARASSLPTGPSILAPHQSPNAVGRTLGYGGGTMYQPVPGVDSAGGSGVFSRTRS